MKEYIPAAITGIGFSTPERNVTNYELEKIVNTTNEWIITRTGIKERRISNYNEYASTFGTLAAKEALNIANIPQDEIDLILVATTTPDKVTPSTACFIKNNLNIKKAAGFDIQSACAGFCYGLNIATQFINTGFYKCILVIGVDLLSKYLNWNDRSTAVIFGDGAGAVVLQSSFKHGVIPGLMGIETEGLNYISIPNNWEQNFERIPKDQKYIYMQGKEVFKLVVKIIPNVILKTINKIGLNIKDIDYFILHQANQRIIEVIAEKLNVDKEKMISNIERYGNTSAASIPIALCEAIMTGKIKKGNKIFIAGFGAGFSWATSIIEWTKDN